MESELAPSERTALNDPQRLTLALEQIGWQYAGGRTGEYARLREPGEDSGRNSQMVIIPLDTEASEYQDDMRAVLEFLTSGPWIDSWTRKISPQLTLGTMDVMRLRKETGTPSGLIPWRVGEEFVVAARSVLVAGAKTYMGPARQYRNRYGRFANRFLDTVMMGQTEPGSYVLSAYAPTSAEVPLHSEPTEEGRGLPNIDFAYSRDVTNAIVSSLEAVTDALEHYRRRASMSGFYESVERGVSYELTKSLSTVVAGSNESDISFELTRETNGVRAEVTRKEFLFQPADAGVLHQASTWLLTDRPARKTTIIGTVHLLSRREAEEPGTVGIDVVRGAEARKVRVTITDVAEYHYAVLAHEDETFVIVTGNLEREGNLWRMYNANLNPYRGQETATPATATVEFVDGDDLSLFDVRIRDEEDPGSELGI
ncbi:hypothetical protein ACW9HK_19645 [Nocardia gipuzkoensis]|uniref:hypothetical protein n=1 Tax=Nocardia TaxID=1817 RepID=UPI0024579737|nr:MULTISPECIES: hypothetical protein [Nocardia]